MSELLKLVNRFESKARSARTIECDPAYYKYWRGYADACDEIVKALLAHASQGTIGEEG